MQMFRVYDLPAPILFALYGYVVLPQKEHVIDGPKVVARLVMSGRDHA